jgi:hypothetical protein
MLGESVQYSRGLTGVGGIELEIVEPIVEKKVLKELAIRELSDVRVPLTFSSVMGEQAESRLAASLSSCHVFLGLLRELARLVS